MRRITTLFALLLVVMAVQTEAQEQLKHEEKWYVSEDSTFYINRHLPIYLRLTTSPDENAKSHLLTSKMSARFSNPLYLDSEGYNTIRTPWEVDPVTRQVRYPKREVTFEVYADGMPPVVKAHLKGAPKYTKGGVTYYGKKLQFSLEAKDALSGVEQMYYSINGAAYKEYSSAVKIDQQKKYKILYYAVDKVGNFSKPETLEFEVDITAPKTAMSIEGDQKDGVLSPRSKLVLTSTDELAGVNNTYYSVDGGKPVVYTTPISLTKLASGDHTFVFYAIDNVRNNNAGNDDVEGETPISVFSENFVYDNEPPITEIKIVGDHHKGAYEYVSPRSKIELTATDKTGVYEIRYGINKLPNEKYTEQFKLIDNKGLQTINYQAEDDVRNVSANKTKVVYYDNKPPVTGITYKYPQFFNRDTLFINKNTPVKLFSGDTESGLAKIEYALDNGSFQTYAEEFKIPNEGYHKIRFRGVDKVNNVEVEKESYCLVDNNAPEIYVNFSISPVGKDTKEGKEYNVYPAYTQIYMGATDLYSGTETIYYSVNGAAKVLYTSAKDLAQRKLIEKSGFYNVKVTAVDKLGNESEKDFNFFISKD